MQEERKALSMDEYLNLIIDVIQKSNQSGTERHEIQPVVNT